MVTTGEEMKRAQMSRANDLSREEVGRSVGNDRSMMVREREEIREEKDDVNDHRTPHHQQKQKRKRKSVSHMKERQG
jgi:hypothetical protein